MTNIINIETELRTRSVKTSEKLLRDFDDDHDAESYSSAVVVTIRLKK